MIISFRIGKEIYKEMSKNASRLGISISQYIRSSIREKNRNINVKNEKLS